jgi:tetratricopeptide (TPR) repeat protein
MLIKQSECGILITSRRQEGSEYLTKQLPIGPLPYKEGIELLQDWAGTYAPNKKVAYQLCKLVDGHPLALRLIGGNIANKWMSASDFLELLNDEKLNTLDESTIYKEEKFSLILKWSTDQLNEAAKAVLRVVGLLAPTFFTKEVIASALNMSAAKAARLLNQLMNYCLVWLIDDWYIISHDLIHDYAQEHHPPSKEIIIRLMTYYTKLVKEQSKLGLEGYKRLEYERSHITAVLVECVRWDPGGDWGAVQNLVLAMDNYLNQQTPWNKSTTALEAGLDVARILETRHNQITFFNMLRGMYLTLDQKENALEYLEQALVIAREIGDRKDEKYILFCLGTAYNHTPGKTNEAIECFEQALVIAREIGDRKGEAEALLDLVDACLFSPAQKEKAIEYFVQARPIIDEVDDRLNRPNLGDTLRNLGNAYHTLGKTNEAIECFEEALVIAREFGDRKREGHALLGLGQVYMNQQIDKAYDYFLLALTITHEIGDRKNEGLTLLGFGGLWHSVGEISLAIECFEEALNIFEEIKSPAAIQVRSLLQTNYSASRAK